MLRSYFEIEGLGKFSWFRRIQIDQWRLLRQYVYQRDNGKCAYCGIQIELRKCHCHHVLPLSEGGTNHPSNLKVLCVECHETRHPHMKSPLKRVT